MKKYLYWAKGIQSVNKNKSYNFISKAFLPIGLKIKDENGNCYRIIDRAEEELKDNGKKVDWDD